MLLGLPEFELLAADTVAEACSLLSRYGADARVLAGGTDLLVKMKFRRTLPPYLINIKRIPDLDGISYDAKADCLRIGTLATIEDIKDSKLVAGKLPVLSETAAKVGTLQIRNLGTLGGNLANASPASEFAPLLLTLGASVRCISCNGERMIPMDELFVGPGKTVLRDDEMLTEITIPTLPAHAAGAYYKHSLRPMEVAVASAAVTVRLEGEICREARIALGAVAPTPFRARRAEAALVGQKVTQPAGKTASEAVMEAARIASDETLPIDDLRGYASYRKNVIQTLVQQGLEEAISQARA